MVLPDNYFAEWKEVNDLTKQIGEHIPNDKLDWKPMDDMNSFGMIARHTIAARLFYFKRYLKREDIEYPDIIKENRPVTKEEFLSLLDKTDQMTKDLLTELEPGDLDKEAYQWENKKTGEIVSYPISWVVWNFKAHERWHQAQLKLYLKLMGEDTSKIGH